MSDLGKANLRKVALKPFRTVCVWREQCVSFIWNRRHRDAKSQRHSIISDLSQ